MRYVAQPEDHSAEIEANTAPLRLWLVSILQWFCEVHDRIPARWRRAPFVRDFLAASKRKITRDLRMSVACVRRMLLVKAYVRATLPADFIGMPRYRYRAPAAVRCAPHRKNLARCVSAGLLTGIHRGTVRERAARLKAIIDDHQALVMRALKRYIVMLRIFTPRALVQTFSREACVQLAAPALLCADTS
jgi:hypothetical protein